MKPAYALLFAAVACDAVAADFRSADFGMSREQVRASEPDAKWLASGEQIGFITEVAGLSVQATYVFINDEFYMGGYSVVEPHADDNAYLNDYDRLKSLLAEKYGKPQTDDTLWRNDLFRREPSSYGMAISIGHMEKMAYWDLDKMEVAIRLSGDNYDVDLWIFYESKAHKDAVSAASKKSQLDGL